MFRHRVVSIPSVVVETTTNSRPLSMTGTQSPFLGSAPSCMHEDLEASDTSPYAGIAGSKALRADAFDSDAVFGGICPSLAFTSRGELVTISVSWGRTKLLLIDPLTLSVISELELPRKKVPSLWKMMWKKHRDAAFRDTAGGVYFFVDDLDRVVIAAADNQLWLVTTTHSTLTATQQSLDLPEGEHKLVSVIPDTFSPQSYWLCTDTGYVGHHFDSKTHWLQLPESCSGHARISNGMSGDPNGNVFVVSCNHLYRMWWSPQFKEIRWVSYKYGNSCETQKVLPGRCSVGSGTTPTVTQDGFVAICDGEQPMRLHVVAVNTMKGENIPVFSTHGSTEISVISHGNAFLVSNTYGYDNPLSWDGVKAPGTTKVLRTESGLAKDLVWDVNAGSVDMGSVTPKLSLGDGVVYGYAVSREQNRWVWRLFGLDWETGKRTIDIRVFDSRRLRSREDNSWGVITLGPRGTVWLGMWTGFMRWQRR